MKKLKIILFILLFFHPKFVEGQTKVKDTITRKATISYDLESNQVLLKAETPPLIQIAGAPKANFSYFWELGDGNFSKEPSPKYTYKKKGNYKVNLAVTNNYDNGKPPKTRPKTVTITEISHTNFNEIANLQDSTAYKIFANREPVPEEEMVVAVSYKNPLNYVANGKLYLFYNDKEFKNDNFELLEFRTHFGEKEVFENGFACSDEWNTSTSFIASTTANCFDTEKQPTDFQDLDKTLLESKTLFRKSVAFEFNDLNPNETRNLFFTFKTTPEMIKDTSATVRIRGVYVPDRNYKNHKKKTLEMEIVTSHDPNKMSSNGMFMNYRLVRFKTLNFKTRFQNDGEGPARTIRLETDVPDMFDKKTLKIVDSYPKCPICPKGEEVNYSCLDTLIKKDQIHFVFKNIYIPGSNQKNVTDKDSTKGFVKYSLKFTKDFHKKTTRSRTAIIFDKNEPVITNYATTRFLPGISIGAKTGYNLFSEQKNAKSYFVGATISPYKSYRFYWQAELYYTYFESNSSSQTPLRFEQLSPPILLNNGTVVDAAFTQTTTDLSATRNWADIVPISLRYTINNYIGVGVGPQFSVSLSNTNKIREVKQYFAPDFGQNPPQPGTEITEARENSTETSKTKAFEKMQTSIFGDVTFGFARVGPSLGIRYYLNFEKEFNYWQFYAIWKF